MSLPKDLLSQAERLAKQEPRRPRQASLRRAVSTAYYALFHLLTEASARFLVSGSAAGGEELRRALRRSYRHLGFRIGEHFCLGSHLARRSQRALFRELAARLDHVELAGEPAQIHASFVVGLKHLPIRYRVRPGA